MARSLPTDALRRFTGSLFLLGSVTIAVAVIVLRVV
ncbi:hypothetical protein SAMN04489832_7221 [Micromonospora cremea]|uniref:Uncharacterized protein n=1 Tax=Micromonospora cremea TaxID=709881 RepID=A0A1N6BDC5_9ACTN|nr:hypothetical protein SAMN04489832_7221 [Micromonospora cremea]